MKKHVKATHFNTHQWVIFVKPTKIGNHENKATYSISIVQTYHNVRGTNYKVIKQQPGFPF